MSDPGRPPAWVAVPSYKARLVTRRHDHVTCVTSSVRVDFDLQQRFVITLTVTVELCYKNTNLFNL